ncbi:MAG: endonuclease III [Rickettsiales bacterium]
MDKKVVNEIFRRFSEKKPAPKIELDYYSPYTLLIAVVLSAQSTDKGVNRATPQLFEIADTPEKMLALGEETLKKYIKTIGLFNSKAKNIILLSKQLLENHAGVVPNDSAALQKLAGVGRKSAHVLLNSLWQKEVIAVDTHVLRVSNRIGLAHAKNVLQTELQLEKVVPKQWKLYAHHWLVLHGRYVCKARKPDCSHCLINDLCKFSDKILA